MSYIKKFDRHRKRPGGSRICQLDLVVDLHLQNLDCIILLLTDRHNTHNQDPVVVSGSSNGETAKRAIDFDNSQWSASVDRFGPWICFDFNEVGVKPDCHTVKSQ
jgi:hypothetical protein